MQHVLTLSLGADQAGWGVAEWAQDGSNGQAQVLVARVQSNRRKAQVRQARSFLGSNFYMRNLMRGEETNKKAKKTQICGD